MAGEGQASLYLVDGGGGVGVFVSIGAIPKLLCVTNTQITNVVICVFVTKSVTVIA